MKLFTIDYWPAWVALGLLLGAAVINLRTMLVPNRLTLPAIVSGWLVAVLFISPGLLPSAGGGVAASIACAIVGGFLLLPFYFIGVLGAGCVKMQMALGAWIGCATGLTSALQLTLVATLAGIVLTGIAAGLSRA